MARLWIVDRNRQRRAALARLAAANEDAVLGAPGDLRFESGGTPDVILMALDADWEQELEFAFTVGRDAPLARWILVGEPGDQAAALDRFDTRDVEFLIYPPSANQLRERISADPIGDAAPSLSERARRETIAGRFGRWFGDLDLPDVLRALDPRLAEVPVLIRGERGTGRSVVARYIHFFGGTTGGTLAHIPCTADMRPGDLISAVDAWNGARPASTLAIWLENLDLLPLSTQRVLLAWIESGPPGSAARARTRRWIATVTEPALDHDLDSALQLALSGLVVELPPLRTRPKTIATLAADTARVWCAARREPLRRLGEDALAVMEEYPWPGNLRELEALVTQSLAAVRSDPVRSHELQLEGFPFSPLNASEIESLIEEPSLNENNRSDAVDAELAALLARAEPASDESGSVEWPRREELEAPLHVWSRESGVESEAPFASDAGTDALLEREPEVVAKPELEVVAEPELKIVAEPELEAMAEPEVEVFAEPELEVVAEPELEVVAEPEPVAVAEPELEVVGEPEAAHPLALHGLDPTLIAELEPLSAIGPFGDGTAALASDADFESFDDLDFDEDEQEEDDETWDAFDAPETENEFDPRSQQNRTSDAAAEEASSEGAQLVSLAHALDPARRDPLRAAEVLSELIPHRFDDPVPRAELARTLREAGPRLDPLAIRLNALPFLAHPLREKVNVAELLEELLEQRRERIRERRLLVLKELDTRQPHALGDPALLALTLETLLGTALDWVPPHGDVYLASRHHSGGGPGESTVRVLIRFHNPRPGADAAAGGMADASPALSVAEALVRAQGGTVGVASTDGEETVVLIDLPAP